VTALDRQANLLGALVPEFLLHIDGEDAWWRWSDESFTQAELET
jgi:hypothetical protein